jgi:hypothetical protein
VSSCVFKVDFLPQISGYVSTTAPVALFLVSQRMHFRQEEPKNVIESKSKPIRIECMAIELRNVKNEQCKPVIFLANKKGRLVLTASQNKIVQLFQSIYVARQLAN